MGRRQSCHLEDNTRDTWSHLPVHIDTGYAWVIVFASFALHFQQASICINTLSSLLTAGRLIHDIPAGRCLHVSPSGNFFFQKCLSFSKYPSHEITKGVVIYYREAGREIGEGGLKFSPRKDGGLMFFSHIPRRGVAIFCPKSLLFTANLLHAARGGFNFSASYKSGG